MLRCHVFDQTDCLHAPERWPDLKSFAMITSERTIGGQTSVARRCYLSSLAPGAERMNRVVRGHLRVENSLHWGMDVVFRDDQARTGTDHPAYDLAVQRQIVLNFLPTASMRRKGGLQVRLLVSSAELLDDHHPASDTGPIHQSGSQFAR